MFSWNENVAISLIHLLRDPELIIYFMSLLKPMRREFVEEEAREWHESLRVSKEDRWKSVSELSKARKFSLMNSSVPITCKLPFDGGMWRNSCALLKSILYFRYGFLKFSQGEISYSKKVHTVNLILGDTPTSQNFRNQWNCSDIREALMDFILFEDTDHAYQGYPELEDEEKPFIFVEKTRIDGEDKPIMNIIN